MNRTSSVGQVGAARDGEMTRLGDRLRLTFDGEQIGFRLWRLRTRRLEFKAMQQLLSHVSAPNPNSRQLNGPDC